ncbi:HAD family hydrolase [Nocardia wallacei]|uniref:HAD family hydrolase n=1 Tax=Nocardia wallacei TaxID=480035 RepID=UPI0024547BCD|nr:HAD hydrolase-like protein [Nocardia wallacei]
MTSAQSGSFLVLWDIDHTMIETRGVGGAAFRAAFEEVTGHPVREMPHITGRTEPVIYESTADLNGVVDRPSFDVFALALDAAYVVRQRDLAARGRILPGVEAALARLAAIPSLHQSVLTGNTRSVSRTKIETFGLHRYLDLDIGAYGDDDGFRPALVSVAQSRAKAQTGQQYDRQNTVLIGDSPGDIETARRGGARIIAVAAGGTPATELIEADFVLDDLTDVDALLKAITEQV